MRLNERLKASKKNEFYCSRIFFTYIVLFFELTYEIFCIFA